MSLRVLALAAAAVVLTAAAPAPKTVELYALDCGVISEKDADAYADDGAYKGVARDLIVPCYLIRHPKGDLLWETGLPQTIYDQPGHKAFGQFTVAHRLTDQLNALGLTPGDIKYMSVSHSHFDHIGNGGLFAASTWIVDADERAYAFRPQQRADRDEFPRYAALETAKTLLIEADAPYDVFGDGSAVIYQAPGHTPGHTVLLVKLKQAGPVLLTGDMWHLAESRAARRVPRFNTDRAQTLQSMDRVEKLAADARARVVLEHVPEDFAALPKFPQPLR
jgi:glyoxylase-like metal-dependent hydrolase (beta-lactamase superfamily II)